jgi:hypothetical protein
MKTVGTTTLPPVRAREIYARCLDLSIPRTSGPADWKAVADELLGHPVRLIRAMRKELGILGYKQLAIGEVKRRFLLGEQ